MKLECEIGKLKLAVGKIERVTGKNLTLPILGSILIVAEKGEVRLRATNLNVGVEIMVPAKIKEDGVVAINGSILNNIFSTIPADGTVVLESQNNNLVVKTEHSSMVIKSSAHEDFPILPKVEDMNSFMLPASKILEGVESVLYSASPSEIKPEIASVYMYYEDESIVFVATDSFRLAEKRIKVKKVKEFSPLLIPVKNIQEIVRVFGDIDDEVEVAIGDNQIAFTTETVYCTSRIVDGVFPDYKQIIPKEFKTEATALKADVVQVLKMTNVFSDKFNQVDIFVHPKEKKCVFQSKNADVGESKVNLRAALTGLEISLSVNHRYLFECFQSIPKDSVTLFFSDVNKPLVVRGVSDPSFTYLVMPMNR